MSVSIRRSISESMEIIDVQSDVFFKELTSVFSKYVGLKRRDLFDSDFKDELKRCLLTHFCDHIDIEMGSPYNEYEDPGYALGMYIPTRNNSLFKSVGGVISFEDDLKITIDYKRATIRGDISKFEPTMYIDSGLIIKSTLTAEEHASVVLHELGHFFNNFAFISRFTTTNQAAAIAAKDMLESGDLGKKKIILRDYAKAAKLDIEDATLDLIHDTESALVIFNNALMQDIRSELGSDTYDMTMNEFMADQFAVRHGAGRYLASGLTALFKATGLTPEQYKALKTVAMIRLLSQVVLMLLHGVSFSMTPLGILSLVNLVGIILSFYFLVMPAGHEFIYDRDKDRIQRIRNQTQVYLRNKKLSKKDYLRIKTDLDEIDRLLAANTNEMSTFGTVLAKVLSPATRARNRQSELQLLLEDLAYNRLHDKAADLKFI